MGWFDEASSDEDGNENGTAPTASEVEEEEEEEEEDPLDAFMNSLGSGKDDDDNASSSKIATSSSSKQQQTQVMRMDMQQDEEDEFDSSTERKVSKGARAIGTTQKDEEEELLMLHDDAPRRTNAARQALNDTFRPAGYRPSQDEQNEPEYDNPHDWSRVGVPQLPKATSTASQQQQQDQKYTAVRKAFWQPTDTPQGHAWRRENDVHCTLSMDPILSFDELQSVMTPGVWQSTSRYPQPTAVQSQTLSVALTGRDVLVTAATGQGKTLAYLWPMATHILDQPLLQPPEESGPIGLVLVPTRELATQVHNQARALLAADGGTSKTIIGGQGKYLLWQEIKKSRTGMEIAVATPGRLLDVLSDRHKKNGITLDRTTMVVLDEADKMLHMGFEAQVRQILQALRPDRQTLLLSATMGRRVEQVAREWLQPDFCRIAVGASGKSSEHVEQHVMVLPNVEAKQAFLLEMVPTFQSVGRAIVFVSTREGCERLAQTIRAQLSTANPNITLDTLHGDKHQSDRTSTLRAFRKGTTSILIASDLAGRGLDVPQVATVVNYDVAKNLDTHVHRIGRAGRLSREGNQQKGAAYTLLTPKDAEFAHVLRNAFVREGRPVSAELQKLADTSRKAGGGGGSRKGGNRAGLGFESDSPAPPAKRSRWN